MLGIKVESPTRSLLVVKVASRACGLPIAAVVEVMRPLPIEALEGAAEGVLGMSIIRGEPLPVVDLGSLLGVPAQARARFVVVRAGERRVALLVDAVIGIRQVAETELDALPPLFGGVRHAAIEAVGTLDAELLVVLSATMELP